ncbi:MAG: XdhC family protein [Bacteroidetes bacterium]|nr:XdhC family protein [Bacteroidota bacterium]
MKSFYQKLSEVEKENRKAALCIVTSTSGSAPRKSASKMIVFENGEIFGTIGGGGIEKKIIEEAINAIKNGISKTFQYNLLKDIGMKCGGEMEVYIEPIITQCKLFIFGAGHIGKSLSKFGSDLGFQTTVIDERPDIFKDYQSDAICTENVNFAEYIKDLYFDNNSYFVIVTHNHTNDFDILKLLCKKTRAFLGMIGSKRKIEDIKKILISEKFQTTKEIEEIDMPIGIPIAAETPEEIAISILAKLIDVRGNLKK